MKQGMLCCFVLLLFFANLTACSNQQEEARIRLAELKVEYSPDTFVRAAKTRDIDVVKLFLQAGMDPDVLNQKGETALLNAARYGAADVVKLLLSRGAEVEVNDRVIGGSALIWAATNGFTDIVTLLLDHGAQPDARENRQGVNALMAAANNGRTETVMQLLERGADVNARDNFNRNALIWAARYGRTDTAAVLLEQGADTTVREKIHGQNALLAASARGRTETIELLLDHGVDLNARDEKGRSALMLAAKGGWPETVKLLLDKGADLNARDQEGRTALDIARAYKHDDIVGILGETIVTARPAAALVTEQVRTITITGRITHEASGYYIVGKQPREVYIIDNPVSGILEDLAESGKTIVIEARIILGDSVAIETIDGNAYHAGEQ